MAVLFPPLSITERVIIKPSSPTPSSLRLHKLSLIDQSLSTMYIPVGFFYPKPNHTIIDNNNDPAGILESSLSRTLTSYYPYAGRLKDNANVECNDKGAEFLKVRVNCTLLDVLNHPDSDAQNVAFPKGVPWSNSYDGGLAVFQLSYFDCGGIALTACMCHKIGDGCTVRNFMGHWMAATRHPNLNLKPKLVGDTMFPTPNNWSLDGPVIGANVEECVQRRFVFSPEKLNLLKNIVTEKSWVRNPTRAELVSSLIYKCAAKASAVANPGPSRPSMLVNYANVRRMVSPPLPSNSVGNIISTFATSASDLNSLDLPSIVGEIRKEKQKLCANDNVKANALVNEVLESTRVGEKPYENPELDMFFCSSLSNYPAYTADFGWGWPARFSMPNGPFKKMFFLMDNQSGGGFEALVMLKKKDMCVFENDEELLMFASPLINIL